MSSGIGRALDELLAERQHLVARIAKLDAGIATIRDLFHLPAAVDGMRAPRVTPPPSAAGNGHRPQPGLEEAIRVALKHGPMGPGELATALQVDRAMLRHHIKQLEARGLVVATGVTAGRRVALAPSAPAKEAP